MRDFTGNTEYKFGDITKTAVSKFTGKDEYEFGDVSKKLGQMLFGNKQARRHCFTKLNRPTAAYPTHVLTACVLRTYLLFWSEPPEAEGSLATHRRTNGLLQVPKKKKKDE